ncbi:neuronal small secreted protein [Caenorhabditis elegans]|uniref:Neuronal small secreted protein n=2 Tax=Caenorhabditis elegans TaxID=6239 RepID=Q23028_CAEEL|nr:Uncharacterized protein CELE_R09F10.5 [Caenorhabditis elegans]CCD69418.1 Uncharacterized protein CELE_R09F10.5 [Caenorhabditis elegans]|eukprot:NP_509404.1 Uncharacterized protein CELE_R09F10.5 [Caenorhabditis elegans]
MALALGATKLGFLFFIAVIFTTASDAHPGKRQYSEKDEYEDVPDQPFPGKVQIMPIVQRDTKHKGVSETVQEIIRELPNDEQYERIGRMLNNSYDAVNKEVAEGKTAIQQKMVMAERRTGERTNSVVQSAGFFILSVILPIIVLF